MTSYIVFIRAEPQWDMFGGLMNEIISSSFPRFHEVEIENLVLDMMLISSTTEAVFVLYDS